MSIVPSLRPLHEWPLQLLIIGSGYVGLVTGACLADLGHKVVCIDSDEEKVSALKRGEVPIFEPGLAEVLTRNADAGRISFDTDTTRYLPGTDAVFIAVGTPPRGDGQGADLSYLLAACTDLASRSPRPLTIVIKSTVPPGTGDIVERAMAAASPDMAHTVVSNPEFLREGSAIEDFMRPDRIVCGVEEMYPRMLLSKVYSPLVEAGVRILFMRRRGAELVKHASNAFLAMKISFINEVADLCEAVDADIEEVARGVGLDRRIGTQFLIAGPGYGGSCFPKDTAALLALANGLGVGMRTVEGAAMSNELRKRVISRRVVDAMGGTAQGKTIAVLGLSFKANTDDVRESPALALIQILLNLGAHIRVYDPQANVSSQGGLEGVFFARDAYECVADADCTVLATEWDEFRSLDINRLALSVRARLFVDLRNLIPPQQMMREGFEVHRIGSRRYLPPNSPHVNSQKSALVIPQVVSKAAHGPYLNGSGHAN